jgi:hypothetical protein
MATTNMFVAVAGQLDVRRQDGPPSIADAQQGKPSAARRAADGATNVFAVAGQARATDREHRTCRVAAFAGVLPLAQLGCRTDGAANMFAVAGHRARPLLGARILGDLVEAGRVWGGGELVYRGL